MIYFPEKIIQWVRYYWGYLHIFSSKLCTLTHTVHARVLKLWRGCLPSVFSSYHVFSPPLSGLNWRSLTPPGGPSPFPSKMATLSTGSAHTPSPGHYGTTPELEPPGGGRTIDKKHATFTTDFRATWSDFWGVLIKLKYDCNTCFFTFCKLSLFQKPTISLIIGYF
jgi:hypothetical protein